MCKRIMYKRKLISESLPTRHTFYIGGIFISPRMDELYEDAQVDEITNKVQRAMVLLDLAEKLHKIFQAPGKMMPNVKLFLSYDQFDDGSIDNVSIKVKNSSLYAVYVRWISFMLSRPAADYIYNSTCVGCGENFVRPNSSDYLSKIQPGQMENIYMCSNCWAMPGYVGFLPIPNLISADIVIRFFVPQMQTPVFSRTAFISPYR